MPKILWPSLIHHSGESFVLLTLTGQGIPNQKVSQYDWIPSLASLTGVLLSWCHFPSLILCFFIYKYSRIWIFHNLRFMATFILESSWRFVTWNNLSFGWGIHLNYAYCEAAALSQLTNICRQLNRALFSSWCHVSNYFHGLFEIYFRREKHSIKKDVALSKSFG